MANDKNYDFFSEYEESSVYDFDKIFLDDYQELDNAFNKMQDLQKKDISARILKAEKQLDKIEQELAAFLNI